MEFSFCFSKTPLPWIAVLGIPVLIITTVFVGYGFFCSIFFTASTLILSSIILALSRPKTPLLAEKLVEEEALNSYHSQPDQCSSPIEGDVSEIDAQAEGGGGGGEGAEDEEEGHQVHEILTGPSPDSYSESDSIAYSSATTDQESEVDDWPYSGNLYDQSPDSSESSISDEESLIEIALPSGLYLAASPKKEELKSNLKQGIPDSSADREAILKLKQSRMEEEEEDDEVLSEMNEEDNLIEIDISMGSIKSSRFEFDA